MTLIDSPRWRTGGQGSPNLGCMILLTSMEGNIAFRNRPNRFTLPHGERVDFGKCGDEVAVLQGESAGISDFGVNDHDVGTVRAYLVDGAYRMKVIATNHLESLRPEMLFVDMLLRHVLRPFNGYWRRSAALRRFQFHRERSSAVRSIWASPCRTIPTSGGGSKKNRGTCIRERCLPRWHLSFCVCSSERRIGLSEMLAHGLHG